MEIESARLPFQVKFNADLVEKLFEKYQEIGFLYPAKKALLDPFWEQINENWKKLYNSGADELLWILTNEDETNAFASISVWKNSNYGLFAQHLVSSGNPFLSLRVMLAAQFKAQKTIAQSSQNWFRPNNRYAYRIFASMFDKLGPKKASLIEFQYLHLKLSEIKMIPVDRFAFESVTGPDPELMQFVERQYNSVFVQAEELDQTDIELQQIGKTYQSYGAFRYRKVFKVRCKGSGTIVATVIVNRTSMGLNFSFLENRAYYIVDEDLPITTQDSLLSFVNQHTRPYYEDFALGIIPIVTTEKTAERLERQMAQSVRTYVQSIWLKSGFLQWYDHIDSFLRKIERRKEKR